MISNDVVLIVIREYRVLYGECLPVHAQIYSFCQVCFVSGQVESLLDNSDRLYFPAFVLIENTIWTAVN